MSPEDISSMRVKHSICLALVAAGLPGLAVPQLLAEKALSKKETRKAERMAERKKKGRAISEVGEKPVIEPLELGPLDEVKNPPPVAINRELALSRQQVQQAAAAIDRRIASKLAAEGEKRNAPSSDEIFVRRIYLDTVGRIPTPEEVKSVVKDANPDKRAALIDKLLVSAGYVSHQFNWYADMLRIKSSIKRAKYGFYQRWLKDGIRENRPWDETVPTRPPRTPSSVGGKSRTW